MSLSVKISDSKFVYSGKSYFRGGCEDVNLVSFGDICAAAFFADAPEPGVGARWADAQAFPGEHRRNRVAGAPI